jgi:hypothetical protein
MGDVAMSIMDRIASLGIVRAPPPVVAVSQGTHATVAAAWFAAMDALAKRRDGERGAPERAEQADEVVKVLDRLYRQRWIELAHARVLRIWGERGQAPDATVPQEMEDARLWDEAMKALDWPLRVGGIVR